ncbi:site-2 protease family protein [Streptomyces sp. CB02400]|uniref:site-2 protease family protein n=1 Tax=Streptomyces sp. CB02400 TaxID=1703944 RepID=UPI00093B5088|nr:site-2 protease family protein [Streptomyces sp. CB02400]OKK09470.1 peptidase [Streptomyces sp. CB02400]
MDVSGGRGQPRPGNDESPDHTGPRPPAPDPSVHGPEHPQPSAAADSAPANRPTGEHPEGTPEHPRPSDTTPGEPPEPTGGPTDEQPNHRPDPPAADGTRTGSQAPGAGPEGPRPLGAGSGESPASAGGPGDERGGGRSPARSGAGQAAAPQRPQEKQRGGLLMGRPFGVPVYVAPSWFLVAILITWVFGGQIDRVLPELGAASYLVSLFFAVAFYASVLVHELAHTLAALRFELPVRRIQLQFFGGVSEIEKEAETPGREFVLAFVGPLLSLVLAGLFYLGLLAVDPSSVPGVLLAGLMISNLIVAVFNLLPGLPLDGGRMLRAVVWAISGKPMTGTIAAAWVGRALAVAVLIGLPLLTQSGALGSDAVDNVGMDTVLDALLAAILAAIIWTGAGNSLRMARLREHLPELRARNLTRRAVPVETDTPLSEALRRANAAGARALVVVDPDGVPLSLVREAAIVGVPEHRRPWVPVGGLAQDLTDGMHVSAELAGEDLLDALRATPATEYLVVEDSGEIYGVLSAADVERAFVKAMARPS